MKRYCVCLILVICSLNGFSQSIKGVDENGEKIILNDNGTWFYETSEKDNVVTNDDLSDCKYWKNEIDEFTNTVKIYTQAKRVGKNKLNNTLSIELRRNDDYYRMYVKYSGDLGCVSSDSHIMIKLLNGEMVELTNFGDIDCGDMNMFFSLPTETMNKLLDSPIDKIRVTGTKYYSDIDKINLPNYFIDNFKCVKK